MQKMLLSIINCLYIIKSIFKLIKKTITMINNIKIIIIYAIINNNEEIHKYAKILC